MSDLDLDHILTLGKYFLLATLAFVVLFALFHLCYERCLKRTGSEPEHKYERIPLELRFRSKKGGQAGPQGNRRQMMDAHRTDGHSILCVVQSGGGIVSGVCAFLGEGLVEYFVEKLPIGDCAHQLDAGVGGHVMAAVSLWTK